MTIEELFKMHEDTCDNAREIMARKNHDYTKATNDPFANFRGSLNYNVHPIIGIFIRIGDKFKRVETFLAQGGLKVADESAIDSLDDVINYVILAKGMLMEEMNLAINEQKTSKELLQKVKDIDIGINHGIPIYGEFTFTGVKNFVPFGTDCNCIACGKLVILDELVREIIKPIHVQHMLRTFIHSRCFNNVQKLRTDIDFKEDEDDATAGRRC